MRAVPRLGELYPGIRLTTEEEARKNLSQGMYDTQLLHVSAVYPGRLQRVNFSFDACSLYGNLSQVIGKV